jgi:hypothetical protein
MPSVTRIAIKLEKNIKLTIEMAEKANFNHLHKGK